MNKYLNERGHRILQALDDVAAEHHATPAHIALAWLMARPGLTAPMASATSIDQLQELVGATRLRLEASSVEFLNRASA
jgi:aryl-alcohol dehydrogenase-like predicted oxidoreductase